jgi:hypothetical protein
MTLVAACGSSSRTTSTFDGPAYAGPAFKNMLVIGIADSYNSRATYERTLAQEISEGGTNATAYYTLAEMDDPIDRDSIENLVNEHGFDSVLITRVLNSDGTSKLKVGSSSAKKVRKDGRPANLFRYDYEEINEPVTLSMELNVVISSEVFSAESRDRVWAVESDLSKQASVGVLIVDAVDVVSAQLRKDRIVAK